MPLSALDFNRQTELSFWGGSGWPMAGTLTIFHWLVDLAVKRRCAPAPKSLHLFFIWLTTQAASTISNCWTGCHFIDFSLCPFKKMKVPESFSHANTCVCMHAHGVCWWPHWFRLTSEAAVRWAIRFGGLFLSWFFTSYSRTVHPSGGMGRSMPIRMWWQQLKDN